MASFLNKLKKAEKIRFYALLLLIGILFTVVSILILSKPKPETVRVDGVITEINSYLDADDDEVHEVYVDYTDLNGGTHEHKAYNSYSSTMKVGKTVAIDYVADNPDKIYAPGSALLPYVFLIGGLLCIVLGISKGIKSIRTKSEDMNELDRTKLADPVSPEEVRTIEENGEPSAEYYFHYTGKLNQSYVMETPQRVHVYEANCDKIGVLSPYEFTFSNRRSGSSFQAKVTHTATTRYGSDSFSVPTKSSFKINGEEVWDYIGRHGYSMEKHLRGIKLNFDVLHHGVPVATLEAAGANILKDGADSKIGEALPGKGLYRVTCRESDLDLVFMCCFAASRVEFF